MTTTVAFPPSAAPALGFLKSGQNDIEIFVEDTATPNMWLNFLKCYIPDGIKLNSVNVPGSRQNVLSACAADQIVDARKKIYIIDGDLDLLAGRPKPRLKHLYRLSAYCIENCLIDEQAFITAITTVDTKIDPVAATGTLSLRSWLVRNESILVMLFLWYAVSDELARHQKTVGYSVYKLIDSDGKDFNLDSSLVYRRIITLYKEVRKHASKDQVRVVFERARAKADAMERLWCVSGKDYLFPPLYQLVLSRFKVRLRADSFKALIALSQEKRVDHYLFRRIKRVCCQ